MHLAVRVVVLLFGLFLNAIVATAPALAVVPAALTAPGGSTIYEGKAAAFGRRGDGSQVYIPQRQPQVDRAVGMADDREASVRAFLTRNLARAYSCPMAGSAVGRWRRTMGSPSLPRVPSGC